MVCNDLLLPAQKVLKENKSVYIASRTHQFCWQYVIKFDEKRDQQLNQLNVKSVRCNGNSMALLSTVL